MNPHAHHFVYSLHLAGRRSPEASLLAPVQTCAGRFGAAGPIPEGALSSLGTARREDH